MRTGSTTPVLWCLAAAALFGACTPASKVLLGDLGPLTLAGLLYLGAALATAPAWRRGGAGRRGRSSRNVRRLAGAVVFGGLLGPVLLLLGLERAPAASVALWLNLETVATALLGVLIFKEHLDWRVVLAVLLVVAGGALLASPEGFGGVSAALLVAGACVCWGLDNNYTALIDGFTPAQSTAVKGLAAGSVNLALGLALEGGGLTWRPLVGALILGSASVGLSVALYIRGAQHLGATRSQLLFSTAPVFGCLIAWLVLREPLLGMQIVAGIVLLGGPLLIIRPLHTHEHTHERMTHTHMHQHDDGHHQHEHPGLPAGTWHSHEHTEGPITHTHTHHPDLHHRHDH